MSFSFSQQQFSPIITPGNEPYLHHVLVYICDGLDGVDITVEGPCSSADQRIQRCLSELLVGAWAVGGEVSAHFFHLYQMITNTSTVFIR